MVMRPRTSASNNANDASPQVSKLTKLVVLILSAMFASFVAFNGLTLKTIQNIAITEVLSPYGFHTATEEPIIPVDPELQAWNTSSNLQRPVRVMLYYGPGASEASWEHIYELLKCEQAKGKVSLVKIKSFKFFTRVPMDSPLIPDVLIVPGGGASSMVNGMGGVKALRRIGAFIRHLMEVRGMGYVGICAGAFLATSEKHGLGITMWPIKQSGAGFGSLTSMEYNRTAMAEIGADEEEFPTITGIPVFYANGPIYNVEPRSLPPGSLLQNPKALTRASPGARLVGPKIDHERVRNIRRNAAIAVYNNYGKGRVILMGPHPETKPKRSSPRPATECDSVWGKYLVGLIKLAGKVSVEEMANQ